MDFPPQGLGERAQDSAQDKEKARAGRSSGPEALIRGRIPEGKDFKEEIPCLTPFQKRAERADFLGSGFAAGFARAHLRAFSAFLPVFCPVLHELGLRKECLHYLEFCARVFLLRIIEHCPYVLAEGVPRVWAFHELNFNSLHHCVSCYVALWRHEKRLYSRDEHAVRVIAA